MPPPTQRRNTAYLKTVDPTIWRARPRPGTSPRCYLDRTCDWSRGLGRDWVPTRWPWGCVLGRAATLGAPRDQRDVSL